MTPPYEKKGKIGWVEVAPSFNDELVLKTLTERAVAYIDESAKEAPYELYNIEEDPGETTNRYFEHPDVVERLTQKITDIIKEGRSTPGFPQEKLGVAALAGNLKYDRAPPLFKADE